MWVLVRRAVGGVSALTTSEKFQGSEQDFLPTKAPELLHSPVCDLGKFGNQIFTLELQEQSNRGRVGTEGVYSLRSQLTLTLRDGKWKGAGVREQQLAERAGEEAKLTDRWGNRDPWREEAHRQTARAQLDAVFTHSNTVRLRKQL